MAQLTTAVQPVANVPPEDGPSTDVAAAGSEVQAGAENADEELQGEGMLSWN